MSKTVTLVAQNAEHTVTIDGNENIIDKLTHILGNIDQYRFTVDKKTIDDISQLPVKLQDNSIIEASQVQKQTRGMLMSLGPNKMNYLLESTKNPVKPIIQIHTIHISCLSDAYDTTKNFAGMILYSYDEQQKFQLNGHRCRTGYILVKDSDKIDHVNSNQGQVHGKLFKWLFGCEHNEKFVCAGFAIQKDTIKYNSSVFNCKDDDYHDDKREMGSGEIGLITYALRNLYMNHAWKSNPDLSVSGIADNNLSHLVVLPYQNYPQSMRN